MVKAGENFIVYDAKTNEDITRSVLTQIIFEQENKEGGQNLLPINFLRQLIRFYGDSMIVAASTTDSVAGARVGSSVGTCRLPKPSGRANTSAVCVGAAVPLPGLRSLRSRF